MNAFQIPEFSDVMVYYDEVRSRIKEYLRGMELEEFDKKVSFANFGDLTIAKIFCIIVAHTSEHIGEIYSMCELQRGMDK